MAHPQVDLACIQVWLIDRGDLCSTCPQRPNCPDQTHCLHLVACGTNSLSGSGTNIPRFDVPNTRMPLGAGFVGRVAATGERLILNASDARPAELAGLDWLEQKGIRSFSGTAISFKGKVLGVIVSFIREEAPDGARPWGRSFADHIGAAIANARAFEKIQRLRAQLEQQNTYLQEEAVDAKAFGALVGQS